MSTVTLNVGQQTLTYLPLYQTREVLLRGEANPGRQRREIEVKEWKASIVKPELLSAQNATLLENSYPADCEGFRLRPQDSTGLEARIAYRRMRNFTPGDLDCSQPVINEDRLERALVDDVVREKAETILGKEDHLYREAQLIYQYVRFLPFEEENRTHALIPREVIERGYARKCLCKSNLFVALCRASGIPAREQGGVYLKKYEQRRRRKLPRESYHSWAVFHYKRWRLVDPTQIGFDDSFMTPNYFFMWPIKSRGRALTLDVKERQG